jgi:hypothetical protein
VIFKFTASILFMSFLYGSPAFSQDETSEGEEPAADDMTAEPAPADGEESTEKPKKKKKKKKKKKEEGAEDKSLVKLSVDNRVGKKIYAALELAGFSPNLGFGLRGGYFLNPDSIVSLSYVGGGFSTKTQKYQKSLFEVTYKRFFTNSLYADAGLGYQKWTADYKVTDNSDSTKEIGTQATISNIGLVLHVGNQWQWRAFTTGCDWAGYFQPLTRSEKFASSSSFNSLDREKEERAVKNNTRSTYHLLRFYAGYAF